MVNRALVATFALAAAGCHKFADPNVVIDLRVLALSATPPDQVVDVDLTQPVDPAALLAQLVPTRVCALVADPLPRRLRWLLTMCAPTDNERCDDTDPMLGSGLLEDPEVTVPEPAACGTIVPDARLLGLVLDLVRGDTLHGLGGIDVQVTLRIGGENADPDLDQYAGKAVRLYPRIPAARSANTNPRVERFDAAIGDAAPVALPLGRCVDNPSPLEIPADAKVRLTPIEPPGVREVYVVPTLDGKSQTFTESLRYQWISSAGGFSDGDTGGPRDISGNPAPLFSDFKAPGKADLTGPTDISLWMIQRDERLGLAWYEACVRVVP